VLNSLFLGLAEQWAKPWTRGHQARELGVGVGGQQISFTQDHPDAKPVTASTSFAAARRIR
jgi:hypothetical protein